VVHPLDLLSVPVQVIAWRTVSEMTYNVSSGTLNLTHSLNYNVARSMIPDIKHVILILVQGSFMLWT